MPFPLLQNVKCVEWHHRSCFNYSSQHVRALPYSAAHYSGRQYQLKGKYTQANTNGNQLICDIQIYDKIRTSLMYLSLCVSLICVYYSHTRSHPIYEMPHRRASSPAVWPQKRGIGSWPKYCRVRSNLRQVVALESWTSGLRFANETLWQKCKAYPSTRTEVESQILHLRKGLAAQLVNDTLFLCHLVADDGHLSAKAWQPHCFMLAGTTGRCDDVGTWIRFSSLLSASIWRK